MSTQIQTIKSDILGKEMSFSIYVPNGYEKICLPVLYFLHGRTGNEQLLLQLGIDKVMDEMLAQSDIKPFIIVCPNMDNSRGINSSVEYMEVSGKFGTVHKGRYEDYFIQELIPFVDFNFSTVCDRNGRFIGGVSAGGYAALHNGLRHCDLFSKIGGHMPAMDLSFEDEDECYFSDEAMWKKYDPFTIAEGGSFADLQVYLDDGSSDEGQFYDACARLYEVLKRKAVRVENHLFDGHHNSAYVISNMKKYLSFYNS